jgi:tetratricopeptide (TPR) repeat protein
MQKIFIKSGIYSLIKIILITSLLVGCANSVKKPEIIVNNIKLSAPVLTKTDQTAYQKALELMKNKSFDEAHRIFSELIANYPNLAGAYVNLAFINKAQSDDTKAEENINKALKINPSNIDALIQRAAYSQNKGEFKKVELYLLAAEAVDSSNEIVQYNLAILYELYLQQYEDAIDHYENYIALSSNEDKETVKRWVMLLERK